MADRADGSIIIDTKLDSKGFDAGSKELLSAIRSLTTEIKTLGEGLKNAFSQQISPNVDTRQAEEQLDALEAKKQAVEKGLAGSGSNSAGDKTEPRPIDTSNADVGNTAKDVAELQKQVEAVNKSVEQLDPSFRRAMTGSESAMSSFVSKSESLEQKIETLRKQLEAVGETRYSTADYQAVNAEVERLSNALAAADEKKNNFLEIGGTEDSFAFRDMEEESNRLLDALDRVLAKRTELEHAGQATVAVADTPGYQQIEASLSAAAARLREMTSAAAQQHGDLQKQIEGVNASVERLEPTFRKAMDGSESAMSSFEGKAETLKEKIAELQENLDRVGQTQYPTQEYEAVCAQVDRTKQRFDALLERKERFIAAGISEDSAQWQTLLGELDAVSLKYQELTAQKQQLENDGGAVQTGVDTSQYAQMESALTAAEEKLREMTSDAAQFRDESAQAESHWAQMPTLSGAIRSSFQQIGAKLQTIGTGLRHPLQAADRLLGTMLQKAKSFAKAAASAAKNVAGKLVSALKSAASHMGQMLTHGKSMKGQFSGLISSAKKFALSLLGARGVFALLRKAVSAYMSENEELSNTLEACWSGIGNLLGPIITKLINLVAQAVAYTTSFLKLFGVFGSSASKAISDTGKTAEKQTKELKRQLASFDELNVLSDNSKDDSDNSDKKPTLPEVELPDWAKEIANLLKAGQWADAATKLAEKLNALIASIDWGAVGDKIGYYLDGILTFLTSFIKAFDWKALGGDLATMLNHVFSSVNWENLGGLLVSGMYIAFSFLSGFFKKLDGKAFGKALYDTIMGAVKFCDWVSLSGELSKNFSDFIQAINFEKLGNAMSDGIRTVLQSLTALITNFDWHGLGTKIADYLNGIDWKGVFDDIGALCGAAFQSVVEYINGFIGRIDFKKMSEGLSSGIRTLLQSLVEGVKTFNWRDLGKKISEYINGIDWAGIFADLVSFVSSLLVGALELLTGAVEELDWAKLGHDIWDMLVSLITNIDWQQIIRLVFEFLGAEISASASFFAALGMDIWEALKNGFAATKAYFDKFIEEAGGNVIKGLWNGIVHALENVGAWIIENIWNPFIEGFMAAFDIHSPSKKMEEMGDFIIEGLWNGIKQSWQNITEFFKNALAAVSETISGAWSGIKSITTNTWATIKSGLSSAWNSLKSLATQSFTNMKTAITNSWNMLRSNASTAWSNIKNTILNQGWSGLGSNICNGIKNGLEAGWEWLKTTVKNLAANLLNAAKNALGIASPSKLFRDEVGRFIGYGVGEGIEDSETSVLRSVTSVADAIADELKAGEYTISEIVPATKVNGALTDFADRITDGFSSMLDRMQAIAESVTFTMPAAAGGMIPYRTVAAVGQSDSGNMGAVIEASNDAMADVIVQAVTNASVSIVEAIRDYSGGSDSFDKDRVADAVIREINLRTRMNNRSPLLV